MLAGDQLGQEFLLLCFGAVAVNLVHAQVRVGTVGQAYAAGCTGNFFHGDHVCQIAHARAAVFFGDGKAKQAHVAEFAPQIHRKLVGAVGFGSTWCDFFGGKAGNRITQHVDVFAEEEVQSGYSAHIMLSPVLMFIAAWPGCAHPWRWRHETPLCARYAMPIAAWHAECGPVPRNVP